MNWSEGRYKQLVINGVINGAGGTSALCWCSVDVGAPGCSVGVVPKGIWTEMLCGCSKIHLDFQILSRRGSPTLLMELQGTPHHKDNVGQEWQQEWDITAKT